MPSALGIRMKKGEFVQSLKESKGVGFFQKLAEPPSDSADVVEVSSWLTLHKVLLNKTQVENLYYHYPGSGPDTVDLGAFIADCGDGSAGRDPEFLLKTGESDHTAHLNLSGTMSIEFGDQFKPFPQHWGAAPNAQMKGHAGIMRQLPGAYGKGNEPMYKWVEENMKIDKMSKTTERGTKPYPFGNYSL